MKKGSAGWKENLKFEQVSAICTYTYRVCKFCEINWPLCGIFPLGYFQHSAKYMYFSQDPEFWYSLKTISLDFGTDGDTIGTYTIKYGTIRSEFNFWKTIFEALSFLLRGIIYSLFVFINIYCIPEKSSDRFWGQNHFYLKNQK